MARLDYLAHLRRELDAFQRCLHGDLAAPVEHCGDWTLYDLADHLGRGNLWAAAAVTERRGSHEPGPAPAEPAELIAWFHDTSTTLLTTLDTDPDTEAWTFAPPRTVGFWQRRRCHETLVHRWDAELAHGRASEIDPALADDGVAEVFDTMAPRQVTRGRAPAPEHAVRFTATDTGSSWVWGPGEPVAAASADAADLLLMLWGRLPSDASGITWEGDRHAAQAVLHGPLVP